MIEYDMNLANFKNTVAEAPETPGVYGFKDDAEKFLYIGQSINLRRRLMEHARESLAGLIERFTAIKGGIKALRLIMVMCERHELNDLEQKLIEIYMPRFNKDWNDSHYDPSLMTTVTINIPVYKFNKLQDMRYREGLSLDEAVIRPLELVLG